MNMSIENPLKMAGQLFAKGDYIAVRKTLEKHLKHHPEDGQAQHLLGNAYSASGDSGNALKALIIAVQLKPDEAAYQFNLANIYRVLGKLDSACKHYQLAVTANPHFADAFLNLGITYTVLADYSAAIKNLICADKIRHNNTLILNGLGLAQFQGGHESDAVETFGRSLKLDPMQTEVLNHLGNCYHAQANAEQAIVCYRAALGIQPDNQEATLNLARSYFNAFEYGEALTLFKKFANWHPEDLTAHIYMAQIYESLHQLDHASQCVKRVLAIDCEHADAFLIQATIARRQGNANEALAVLRQVDVEKCQTITARGIKFELGKTCDQLQYCDDAYQNFCEGNALLQRENLADKNSYLEMLDALQYDFDHQSVPTQKFKLSPNVHSERLVFLLGFPRSGTTLLDQILDSNPQISVVEEQAMIDVLREKLAQLPLGYPGSLAKLEKSDVESLRAAYLHLLGQHTDLESKQLIVDKYPLNLAHAGFIKMLFPEAKFLLAMRHPCDVVLSCFMQPFLSNSAMANFHTIKDTATLYCKVMDIWQSSVELLDLDYKISKYEALVDDFETTARALFTFLNVDWHDNALEYANHARQRGLIRTPSYNQVTRPIYQDAKYRWLRYAKHLEVEIERLQPYIDAFGYTSTRVKA